MAQNDSHLDLGFAKLDLENPSDKQQIANMAGMAAGFAPGGEFVRNVGGFAFSVLGDSYEGEISRKHLTERYGDLLYWAKHGMMPSGGNPEAVRAEIEAMSQEEFDTLIESHPELEGLRTELELVGKKVARSPMNHLTNLLGGLAGAFLMGGIFPPIGSIVGGFAGGFGADYIASHFREDALETSAVRMYEVMMPAMREHGMDAGMAYAMLVARSHDREFIKQVEDQLQESGMTLEAALEEHVQLVLRGHGETSELSRLAQSDFDNADFLASCGCKLHTYDITRPIPQQIADRINRGEIDPRALVLGDGIPAPRSPGGPMHAGAEHGMALSHGLPPLGPEMGGHSL